ncbi:MAG: FKBP-type peptidyl-prolyl cis-trans isomerase [Flavobacteriales bacterium]|nr:FKBP-type peptidyl-prolyl cis-trans isomerase [Flavobacteriales bacterium]
MKKIIILIAIGVSQFAFSQKTEKENISYAVGIDFARNLQQLDIDYDVKEITKALKDFKNNKEVPSKDSIGKIVNAFLQKKFKEKKEKNKQLSIDYLAKNKNEKGVKTTDSGLQYIVLKEGEGEETPKPTDKVTVNYEGKLQDGIVFDSTKDNNGGKPREIALNQAILGWSEGIQLMKKGAKYRFFVPPSLGYGENGTGPIPPYSVLIFDVELVDFKSKDDVKKEDSHEGHNH